MELPPLEPLDIKSLDPIYHELTLSLPAITTEGVSAAFRGFSSKITEVCCKTAYDDPRLFVDIVGRAMLSVSSKIIAEPQSVFGPLRSPEYRPWTERHVTLLAPSAEKASSNDAIVLGQLRELGATDEDIKLLFWMATTAVVGSLATIGRLPM